MVFNVLAHNRDDHVKNFSFILDDLNGKWCFAPAYDLTFTHGPGGEHSSTEAGEGANPEYHHFVSLAERYDIERREMAALIEAVQQAVERWPEFADLAGVSAKKKKEIAEQLQRVRRKAAFP